MSPDEPQGVIDPEHAPPPTRASTLRRRWLDVAFESAEIDAAHWDPRSGVDLNRATIERVYDYYGRLYIRDERLEWAGMANLIGPSFYAGFLDVGFLPDRTRRLVADVRATVDAGRRRVEATLRRQRDVDALLTGDLGFFETTFLTMQRKIFEDQALMHEAYLGDGLQGIHALRDAGIIDTATELAWEQIDRGDREHVHAGNRTLLYREQHDIIDRFYVDIRDHSPPTGRLFTYLLTIAGAPAVPGAKTYSDVFPLTLATPMWRDARIALRTPLPAGDLALFPNRWRLIADDTLPAYQHLIDDQGQQVEALIEEPVARRATRFRMARSGGRLALSLATHWRLAFVEGAPPAVGSGAAVEIDLRTPPTRATAGLAPGEDSFARADPHRHPFPVSVSLPRGRVFSTEAVLVVLWSAQRGADPTRLSVKLPEADLQSVRNTLTEHAAAWGLDHDEIATWAQRAAAVTTAQHVYSTRVFDAAATGSVRFELQVEHHIEQDTYVIDALFTW